jgi:hypothetical protein
MRKNRDFIEFFQMIRHIKKLGFEYKSQQFLNKIY